SQLAISASLCDDLVVAKSELNDKYVALSTERIQLYSKVKTLEDSFLKRGQTDQTIHLNQPKDTRFYNPKGGIGFDGPKFVEKIQRQHPTLYGDPTGIFYPKASFIKPV